MKRLAFVVLVLGILFWGVRRWQARWQDQELAARATEALRRHAAGAAAPPKPRPVEARQRAAGPREALPPELVRPGIPSDALSPSPPRGVGDDARILVRSGYELTLRGDYLGARDELDRGIYADPANHEAHYWRGVAVASTGAKASAVWDLRKTVQLKGDYAPGRSYLGALENDLGRADEAIAQLTHVIEQNPSYHRGLAHALRAVAHLAKRDVRQAVGDALAACRQGNADGCRIERRWAGGERWRMVTWTEL